MAKKTEQNNFWIFKVSDQDRYPDKYGEEYVFDDDLPNSTKVTKDDEFLYLDKRGRNYQFTGAGTVKDVITSPPDEKSKRTDNVTRIFTALLDIETWFVPPFDFSPRTLGGRSNRDLLGIIDVNKMGWSISIPSLKKNLFARIIDVAVESSSNDIIFTSSEEYIVEDTYSVVRTRKRMGNFRKLILKRHNYQCLVCGTAFIPALEAAHIRSYSEDPINRANPANGICLCKYCHAAFDTRVLTILTTGELVLLEKIVDKIADTHFKQISKETRKKWLEGVELSFLEERNRNILS
jgi:hypothetical protein